MSKGQQTRREIISGALSLAGEVGLENVTLGVLAAELELSKSGLFAHFRSKEALQLAVLNEAIERFTATVIRPAFEAPRGAPRFVALFERHIAWVRDAGYPGRPSEGRCIFMALSQEYADRPGELRDVVVKSQRDWRHLIANSARMAMEEAHFSGEIDVDQIAFEFAAIGMAYQHSQKILAERSAEQHARIAFAALLERCRVVGEAGAT